jgi:hypothetical protein
MFLEPDIELRALTFRASVLIIILSRSSAKLETQTTISLVFVSSIPEKFAITGIYSLNRHTQVNLSINIA